MKLQNNKAWGKDISKQYFILQADIDIIAALQMPNIISV